MKKLYEFYAPFLISAPTGAEMSDRAECQILHPIGAELSISLKSADYISAPTVAEIQTTEKLQPLVAEFPPVIVAEVGWKQNCIILEKCKDLRQIFFYLQMTKEKGWSKLDLLDKIKQNYFENSLLAQNNFQETVSETLKAQVAREFIDDYNIELLNPDQPVSEKALENAIVENIVKFLHEMGGNFAFVGRQYRLTLEEKEYFVDLLFFNFKLNCYVVFELKAREFQPKDFGQVQMYMQLINKQVKQPHHNLTIGVIVCRSKNRVEVEYMLEQAKDPVGVATYNCYADLPEQFAKYLPSEQDISKRINAFTPAINTIENPQKSKSSRNNSSIKNKLMIALVTLGITATAEAKSQHPTTPEPPMTEQTMGMDAATEAQSLTDTTIFSPGTYYVTATHIDNAYPNTYQFQIALEDIEEACDAMGGGNVTVVSPTETIVAVQRLANGDYQIQGF